MFLKKLDLNVVADELLLISDTYFITRYVIKNHTYYVHYSADATLIKEYEAINVPLGWIANQSEHELSPRWHIKWWVFKICVYNHEGTSK